MTGSLIALPARRRRQSISGFFRIGTNHVSAISPRADETYYPAGDVIGMLDRFRIDHTFPCLAVNRWITAMLDLFRPQIEALVTARDETVAQWARAHPDRDVYEDRELEITSIIDIDADRQIVAVRAALESLRTPA